MYLFREKAKGETSDVLREFLKTLLEVFGSNPESEMTWDENSGMYKRSGYGLSVGPQGFYWLECVAKAIAAVNEHEVSISTLMEPLTP